MALVIVKNLYLIQLTPGPDRTLPIPGENRTLKIPGENRTLKVKK